MKPLRITADEMSRIAFANQDAVITFTADAAYCTHEGVTYVAELEAVR